MNFIAMYLTTKDVYLQITETILANSNSKDGQIKKLNANSKLLANFQFNISSNNYMLMMIMAHYYANVLGYTEKKVIGGTLNCSEDIIAICDEGNINSNNLYFDEEIYLGMINGKINPKMSNKYDLMNTLVHERTHLPDHGVQAGAEYPSHFEAYIAQFEHWTWEKTTDEFKQTQISNASENLAIFKYSKPKIYNSYKARIEKALGIVYDELDYEWKEDGKGDKELVYKIKYHEVK